MERFDEVAPRTRARITGVIYLTYFVSAILGEVFLQQAGISAISPTTSDAGTLARNLLGHQAALQLGIALGLISVACYIAVTALFYQLFKPVSNSIALLALSFGMVAMAITAFAAVFELAPVAVLGSANGLSATERQSVALALLKVGDNIGPVSLLFSGFFQLLIGYLMFRSGYIPRVFGVLIAVAGLGWFVYLAPPLANSLTTVLEVIGFLGELPLMLWLLIMGVNSQRWNERVAAGALRRRESL